MKKDTPETVDVNYFKDSQISRIQQRGWVILMGCRYDYKDGKLIKHKNNMKKDWKFWVMVVCFGISLVGNIVQKDFLCAIWVLSAGLSYLGFRVAYSDYERCSEEIKHCNRIINLQSERIKELENKLNGKI